MKLLGTNIIVELDPEVRKIGSLFMPDEDAIKFCKRCQAMMENLSNTPCVGEEVYEHDDYIDGPRFRGVHYEHDVVSITAPIVESETRKGIVRAIGTRVHDVSIGDIVYVGHTSGGTTEDVRFIQECEILMKEETC